MRLLLDTHIVVWSLIDSPRLSADCRALLRDPSNEISASAINVWEIAIKHGQRRAEAMPMSGMFALERLQSRGIPILEVTGRHAAAVDHLPPIHGDPFDRMLVAQALTEPLRLLTSDAVLARYSDTVILV